MDAFISTMSSAANKHPRSLLQWRVWRVDICTSVWSSGFMTRSHGGRPCAASNGDDWEPKIASAEGSSPSEISTVVLARLAVDAAELALAANAEAEEGVIEGAGEEARPRPCWRTVTSREIGLPLGSMYDARIDPA